MGINGELRIKFLKNETIAQRDKTTFENYSSGKITIDTAIKQISRRNGVEITDEQFLANLEWLGYRKGKIND